MKENDDPDYEEDDNFKPPCHRCLGTGFANGKLCPCIGPQNDDEAVKTLMGLFGLKK